jgi:hypothetical protein
MARSISCVAGRNAEVSQQEFALLGHTDRGRQTGSSTMLESVEAASEEALLNCLGRDAEKSRVVREAAAAIRFEPEGPAVPVFPGYEA